MIAVRDVPELDSLPVDASVTDFQRDVWRKRPDGRWIMRYDDAYDERPLTSATLRYLFGPLWRDDPRKDPA